MADDSKVTVAAAHAPLRPDEEKHVTTVHGTPAGYARTQLVAAGVRRWAGSCIAAAGVLGAASAGNAEHSPTVIGTFCAAAVVGLLLRAGTAGRTARLDAGVNAEVRVAKLLARVGADVVIHGADLGRGGDIDHIVIGPGFFIVETKYGRGRITTRRGQLKVAGRTLPRDPIAQVKQQQGQVVAAVGRRPEAVVCISHGHGRPRAIDGVTVCSARHLRRVLRAFPTSIGGRDVDRLERILTS